MRYYTMEQEFDRVDSFVIAESPDIQPPAPWYSGLRFAKPPSEPIVMTLESGSVMPDFFDAGVPVFSAKLCEILRSFGVTNFDAYPVSLLDPVRGCTYEGRFAVNVVGLAACADMQNSVYLDPTGQGLISVFFSQLKINSARASGLHLFRLAESVGELVVSEMLVERLQASNLVAVRFLPA